MKTPAEQYTQGTITATINPDSILPVTLLTTDEIFGGRLEQLLDEFDRVDDVFVPDFGGVLVEKAPGNETNSTYVRVDVGRDVHHLEVPVGTREQLYELPSGPYILHGPNVYQAWRLYEDSYEAFDFGVIPENVTRIDRYECFFIPGTRVSLKQGQVPSPQRPVSWGCIQVYTCPIPPLLPEPVHREASIWRALLYQRRNVTQGGSDHLVQSSVGVPVSVSCGQDRSLRPEADGSRGCDCWQDESLTVCLW